MFNALAAQRWRRYQSVEQLLSTGSLTELVAMSVIVAPVTDNSSAIERGHTGTQRAARAREQTHDQRLSDISADRVIRQVQRIGLVWPGCIARTHDGNDTKGSFNPDSNPAGALHPRRRPHKKETRNKRAKITTHAPTSGTSARKSRKPGKKKYPVTKCAAWMSANVCGRLITKDDYQAYHWDMQDPTLAAKYEGIAQLMNLAPRK